MFESVSRSSHTAAARSYTMDTRDFSMRNFIMSPYGHFIGFQLNTVYFDLC